MVVVVAVMVAVVEDGLVLQHLPVLLPRADVQHPCAGRLQAPDRVRDTFTPPPATVTRLPVRPWPACSVITNRRGSRQGELRR